MCSIVFYLILYNGPRTLNFTLRRIICADCLEVCLLADLLDAVFADAVTAAVVTEDMDAAVNVAGNNNKQNSREAVFVFL